MIPYHAGSFNNDCASGKQRDKNDDTGSFIGESLAWTSDYTRKRNEGIRKTIHKENIKQYSPCSKRKISDNVKKNKDNVSESIRRGRAALAEAEEHIKMFEDYLRSSSSQDKTVESQAPCEEKIPLAPSIFFEELSSLQAPLSKDPATHSIVIHEHESCQLGSTDLMKTIIKEGEERCKRDELIAAAFRQGDVKLKAGRQVLRLIEQDGNQKFNSPIKSGKNLRTFDPNNLAATKRCVLKAAKAAEEKANHDAEEVRQCNFKARPLPGGIWVKNDPYALTKSALSKISSGDEKNINGSTIDSRTRTIVSGEIVTSNMKPSLILNDTSELRSSHYSEASQMNNTGDKNRYEKGRRNYNKENLIRKKRMYKAVTRMIMNEFAAEDNAEDSLLEEEDILSMRQQIAKLKAQLKCKRKQCIKVIDAIDDERKKWDNSNDDASSTFGDIIDVHFSESITDADGGKEESTCKSDQSKVNKSTDESIQSSVYERHQLWLHEIEKRRTNALAQKDNEALMNMTGKPELNNTNTSWIRAKTEHDKIAKVERTKEKALQDKRNTQEMVIQQKETDEADRLQYQILKKHKEIRKGISKKNQSDYVDKLVRTSTLQRAICPAKSEEVDKRIARESETSSLIEPETKKHDSQDEMEKSIGSTDKCEEEISFAEMGDKEFERMVKKLGIHTRKGQKNLKNRRTKMHNTVIHNMSIKMHPRSQRHDDLLTIKEDNTPKVSNLKSKKAINSISKNGRFTSGTAQARLMVELKDTDLHEYTVATARSALDAVENEGTLQRNERQLHQHISESSCKESGEGPKSVIVQQNEPYERFETGKSRFFDKSSSTEKGRFRVRDARDFAPDTMRRVPAPNKESNGVMFLVGKRRYVGLKELSEELVITVLFDRSLFSENAASEWWYANKYYFIPDENQAIQIQQFESFK